MIPVRVVPLDRTRVRGASMMIRRLIGATTHYTLRERRENQQRYTPSALLAMVDEDAESVLVAMDAHRLVGFCCTERDSGPLYLRWMGVVPRYRGHGIADALLVAVQQSANRRGCYKVYADTTMANASMARASARAGFVPVGVQWEWVRSEPSRHAGRS